MSAAQEIKYKLKNIVTIACLINITNDTKKYHTIISKNLFFKKILALVERKDLFLIELYNDEHAELDKLKGRNTWPVRRILVRLAFFTGLRVRELEKEATINYLFSLFFPKVEYCER